MPVVAKKVTVAKKKKKPEEVQQKVAEILYVPSEEEAEEAIRRDLADCNSSELVEICRKLGLVADRTVPMSDLRRMALTGEQVPVKRSRIQEIRELVQGYIDRNPSYGTDPRVCPRDCSRHPDFWVLSCYEHNKSRIELDACANRMTDAITGARDGLGVSGRGKS